MAEHKQAIIRPVSDFALHMPRPFTASLLTVALALTGLAASAPARSEGSIPSSALISSGVEASLPLADQVVVRKGERKLLLLRQGTVLRTFKVVLGLNP